MKLRSWVVFTFAWLALSACNRSPAPRYAPKQVPLALEVAGLTRLEIMKREQQSGESWTTLLSRPAPDSTQWRVESSPSGQLGDRLAARGLINHLLSTLTTLQIKEVAPAGKLESFGLAPPQIGLKLYSTGKPMEVRIGSKVTHAGSEKGTRYALFSSDSTVYVVHGAALQMLDYIDTFSTLRQQIWLDELDSDDIDEIEIFEGPTRNKSLFYAQREGSVWTDRKSKPIPSSRGDAQALLDHLVHARVQDFVDDSDQNRKILEAFKKKSALHVVLTHRGGDKTTQLSLAWVVVAGTEGAYGTVDTRADWSFRLHPETLRLLEKFRK